MNLVGSSIKISWLAWGDEMQNLLVCAKSIAIIALSVLCFSNLAIASGNNPKAGWTSAKVIHEACAIEREYQGFKIGIVRTTDQYRIFISIPGKQIEKDKEYQAKLSFPATYENRIAGIGISDETILFSDVFPTIFGSFSRSANFAFYLDGYTYGEFDLKGSGVALDSLGECKAQLLAQKKQADQVDTVQVWPQRQKVDIGQCPMNTTKFEDDQYGTTFEVKRVGRNGYYDCNGQIVDQISGNEECVFMGDTVLEGKLAIRNLDIAMAEKKPQEKDVFLTFSRIDGGPCCSWSISEEDEATFVANGQNFSTKKNNFRWFDSREMISVKQFGMKTIDPELSIGDSGEKIRAQIQFPLIAASCNSEVLYAVPDICRRLSAGEELSAIFPEGNDGIWWIKGNRIRGHEYDCDIRQIKDGKVDIHCDMGDFGVWDESATWKQNSASITVGEGTPIATTFVRCDG